MWDRSQPTGARIRGVPEWVDGILPVDPLRRTLGASLLPQSQPSTDRKAPQVRHPVAICIRLDAYSPILGLTTWDTGRLFNLKFIVPVTSSALHSGFHPKICCAHLRLAWFSSHVTRRTPKTFSSYRNRGVKISEFLALAALKAQYPKRGSTGHLDSSHRAITPGWRTPGNKRVSPLFHVITYSAARRPLLGNNPVRRGS